jgi:L-fuconolactonase
MFEPNVSWLAQVQEDPIDPERPIIDAHHHFVDAEGAKLYGPEQLIDDITTSGHRVEKTMFAETGGSLRPDGPVSLRSLGETEYATRCAKRTAELGGPEVVGIVGHVDLRLDELEDVVALHVEAAGGLFRGIRHSVSNDETGTIVVVAAGMMPPGLLMDESFRRGAKTVAKLGLVMDTFLYSKQLPDLGPFLDAVPETTVVLDHIGGPVAVGAYSRRRDEVMESWKRDIVPIAAHENVRVKIGGIAMPLMGLRWQKNELPPTSDEVVAAWGDAIRLVIETFGPDRCMFESNFPVDKLTCGYGVLWNAYKKITADLSESERDRLFWGTATEVYGLA